MQNLESNIEILAPAGDIDSLKVAVNCGANAVYLGLKSFSARAKANNFDEASLKEGIEYAHLFNVRIYLAVNTLYKKEEKAELLKQIKRAHELGVDAIIVQDLTILQAINSTMPDIIVHFSTQSGVHNVYGATVAEKLGADRIILSRETTIEDIREIKSKCSIEIEAFVQGALCVSFSGNCYFSSLVSGYSGNRGKCLQLCRKKYFIDNNEGYWLSPKDLLLADKIQAMIDAGVTSFKIEGRMRRPEYVGSAVLLYKNAIEGKNLDYTDIKSAYNRGNYTHAHLFTPTENVIYKQTQNHIGYSYCKVLSVKNKTAILSKSLEKHDAVKFFRNGKEVGTAVISNSGTNTTFLGDVKAGDEVAITTKNSLATKISSTMRNIPISCKVTVENNQPITLTISSDRLTKTYNSDFLVETASKSPLLDEDVTSIVSKCKDYPFEIKNIEVVNDHNSFVVKSAFNGFRREVYKDFFELYSKLYKKPIKKNHSFSTLPFSNSTFEIKPNSIFVMTDDFEMINHIKNTADYVAYQPTDYNEFLNKELKDFPSDVFLFTPQIARNKDLRILEKISQNSNVANVIVNNIYGLELFKDKNVVFGPFMNVIDDSFECNKILSVEGGISKKSFTYAFGYFPFMTLTHCPNKTIKGSCQNCNGYKNLSLQDERGNNFTFKRHKIAYCYSHLHNELPINLSQFNANEKFYGAFVDVSGFSKDEALEIIKCFNTGKKYNCKSFTAFATKNLE